MADYKVESNNSVSFIIFRNIFIEIEEESIYGWNRFYVADCFD